MDEVRQSSLPAARLERVGLALYGRHWHALLARDLAVADRTVRRWATGAKEPPDQVWQDLRDLMERRAASMAAAAIDLGPTGPQAAEPPPQLLPPPGWGSDTLTRYLSWAHQNRFATFDNKKSEFNRLADLDACFEKMLTGWKDPSPPFIAVLLFIRGHSALRTACENAMAGQIAETFTKLRSCLEYGAYALHIKRTPGGDETWLRRHDNEAAMKQMKSEFTIAKVRATIAQIDTKLAPIFADLYDRTIDFGAHPNERAVSGSALVTKRPGSTILSQLYLHTDGLQLKHGLRSAAQVSVCALSLLQQGYPERFHSLGLDTDLASLRQGL
jgi:hypothetical protein